MCAMQNTLFEQRTFQYIQIIDNINTQRHNTTLNRACKKLLCYSENEKEIRNEYTWKEKRRTIATTVTSNSRANTKKNTEHFTMSFTVN